MLAGRTLWRTSTARAWAMHTRPAPLRSVRNVAGTVTTMQTSRTSPSASEVWCFHFACPNNASLFTSFAYFRSDDIDCVCSGCMVERC